MEQSVWGRKKKSYPAQTAVDSFFNYLYYSTQTVKSEMFASTMDPLFRELNRNGRENF